MGERSVRITFIVTLPGNETLQTADRVARTGTWRESKRGQRLGEEQGWQEWEGGRQWWRRSPGERQLLCRPQNGSSRTSIYTNKAWRLVCFRFCVYILASARVWIRLHSRMRVHFSENEYSCHMRAAWSGWDVWVGAAVYLKADPTLHSRQPDDRTPVLLLRPKASERGRQRYSNLCVCERLFVHQAQA